jgi:hypothetical protein
VCVHAVCSKVKELMPNIVWGSVKVLVNQREGLQRTALATRASSIDFLLFCDLLIWRSSLLDISWFRSLGESACQSSLTFLEVTLRYRNIFTWVWLQVFETRQNRSYEEPWGRDQPISQKGIYGMYFLDVLDCSAYRSHKLISWIYPCLC